jgi:anti-sigma regulatory factor (Ser/Thr protein kinase)
VTSQQPPPPDEVTIIDITAVDLATVRLRIHQAAEAIGLDQTRTGRFALAASEITANAIEHGRPPRSVVVRRGQDRIIVEVTDAGPGFTPLSVTAMPATDGDRGRGLWLARQWADRLDIGTSLNPFTVRLTALRHVP